MLAKEPKDCKAWENGDATGDNSVPDASYPVMACKARRVTPRYNSKTESETGNQREFSVMQRRANSLSASEWVAELNDGEEQEQIEYHRGISSS